MGRHPSAPCEPVTSFSFQTMIFIKNITTIKEKLPLSGKKPQQPTPPKTTLPRTKLGIL
jgi:hypothetical protein